MWAGIHDQQAQRDNTGSLQGPFSLAPLILRTWNAAAAGTSD
jgi:hypothetical protein